MEPVYVEELPGFDLLEVRLKDFLSYGSKEAIIPFTKKLIAISGVTGSGKTSILDGITFALYRRSSRLDIAGIKTDTIIKQGGYAYVKFKISKNKMVEVKRGIRNDGSSYLEVKINGNREHGNINELNKKIETIIGLDYTSFINSSIVRQDEMKAIGNARSSDRLKILQGLFQLNFFEKARDVVSDRLKAEEQKRSKIEGVMETKQKEIEKLPGILEEKDTVKAQINQIKHQITVVEKEITEKKARRSKLEETYEKYKSLNAQLETLKEAIEKNKEKLEASKKSQKQIEILKQKLKVLKAETADLEQLRKELIDLEKNESKVSELQEQKKHFAAELKKNQNAKKTELQELDIEVKAIEQRKANIQTDIDVERAFQLLRSEGRLIERKIRIPKELEWLQVLTEDKLLKQLKMELKDAEQKHEELKEMISRINQDSFLLSELEKQERDHKDKKAKVNLKYVKKIEENGNKLMEIKKRINSIFSEQDKQKLEQVKSTISDKEQKLNELDQARAEIDKEGDYSKLIKSITNEIENLSETTSKIEKQRDELKPIIKEFDSITNQIEELGEKINNLKIEKAKSEKDLQRNQELIENIEKMKSELETDLLKQDEIIEEIDILTKLREQVFHIKGATLFAIKKLLPRIAKRASLILSKLTDKRYSNIILEEKQIKEGKKRGSYGFDILIGTPTGYRDISTFSGGEKTQINASLRLAVSEELAVIPRPTMTKMKTLFIDEGDIGQLDTWKSRDDFVDNLLGLTQIFNKIIFITHIEEISRRFPGRIEIRINAQGQSNVVVQRF